MQGFRWNSTAKIGSLPLVSIAVGPDPALGHMRGYALGGAAFGEYVIGPMQQDPEALDFFGTYAPWLLP